MPRDLVDHAAIADGPAGSRRRRACRAPPECRAARRCAAGPTPDSSSICGEPIEPAARITSPRQRAQRVSPFCRQRTPAARACRRRSTRSTMQPVSSRRFCRLQRRLEKAARRRPAPAALLVDVEIAGAFVVAGVEIVDLDAGLLGRVAEGVEQVPAHARMLDPPFAADRVMLAGAEEVMLVLAEIGSTSSQPQPLRPSWRQWS